MGRRARRGAPTRAAARLPGRLGARARYELLRRIARDQVADFGADVVLCQDMSFFARADLDALRADVRLWPAKSHRRRP